MPLQLQQIDPQQRAADSSLTERVQRELIEDLLLFNVRDTARLLGHPEEWVRQEFANGNIAGACKLGGSEKRSKWVISGKDLRAYIEGRKRAWEQRLSGGKVV